MKAIGWVFLLLSSLVVAVGVYQFATANELSNAQAISINEEALKSGVQAEQYGGRGGAAVSDELTSRAISENRNTALLLMCGGGAGIVVFGIVLIVAQLRVVKSIPSADAGGVNPTATDI